MLVAVYGRMKFVFRPSIKRRCSHRARDGDSRRSPQKIPTRYHNHNKEYYAVLRIVGTNSSTAEANRSISSGEVYTFGLMRSPVNCLFGPVMPYGEYLVFVHQRRAKLARVHAIKLHGGECAGKTRIFRLS